MCCGTIRCGSLSQVGSWFDRESSPKPDFGGVLRQSAGAWTGTLPQGAPVANSTVEWSGVRWIMLIGPPPADATERQVLIAHEAWHRIQDQLGIPAVESSCAHLETERGRYLMRLELRALATAMRSRGAEVTTQEGASVLPASTTTSLAHAPPTTTSVTTMGPMPIRTQVEPA